MSDTNANVDYEKIWEKVRRWGEIWNFQGRETDLKNIQGVETQIKNLNLFKGWKFGKNC